MIGRLPSEFGNVFVLALDYPSELPYTVELSSFLLHSRTLSNAARKIPAAFLLAASYLSQRADVDTARIADAAMHPFDAFAPERFVARIAPRPLVMVNGLDDPQMPTHAVRRLYDAARLLGPCQDRR